MTTVEPLALQLLRKFERGATINELVRDTGIPRERLVARLRAARLHRSGGNIVRPGNKPAAIRISKLRFRVLLPPTGVH